MIYHIIHIPATLFHLIGIRIFVLGQNSNNTNICMITSTATMTMFLTIWKKDLKAT